MYANPLFWRGFFSWLFCGTCNSHTTLMFASPRIFVTQQAWLITCPIISIGLKVRESLDCTDWVRGRWDVNEKRWRMMGQDYFKGCHVSSAVSVPLPLRKFSTKAGQCVHVSDFYILHRRVLCSFAHFVWSALPSKGLAEMPHSEK